MENLARRVLHGMYGRIISRSSALHRTRRVAHLFERRRWHALLRRMLSRTWGSLAPLRPLLSVPADQLTLHQRLAKTLAEFVLSLPDIHYRRRFRQAHLVLSRPLIETPRSSPRNGTLMMIGTLGPGGAERQLVSITKAIASETRTRISVACIGLSNPSQRFFLPDLDAAGVPATIIGSQGDHLPAHVASAIASLPGELHEVTNYAMTLNAELPRIAHLWLDEINVKGGIAAVLTGVPLIILSQRSLPPQNFGFHQPYMREAYRWLAKQRNVVMVNNSEMGARAYEEWLGLPAGKILVTRNGYAFDEETRLSYRADRGHYRRIAGIPDKAPVVGTVIRLSEEKRPFLWLEIAARVRRDIPEAHFLIVGDGPLRPSLEQRARQPDLSGSVHFIGIVTGAQAAMVDMDLLLLTSRAEGLPNVLIEAQFVGVPVVTTRVGGAPEAVDHGRSGWVLEHDDAETAGARLVALLRDQSWRHAAAQHGPEFAVARFGMRRAIDDIKNIYAFADRSNEVVFP